MKWRTPVILGLVVFGSAVAGLAQNPTQNRIPQQIVINGQHAGAAYVLTANGAIQNYTCSAPQGYVTPDGASQGWACFESSTGIWLLGALPPQAAAPPAPQPQYVPAAPPVAPIYQVAPPPQIYATAPQVVYATTPQVVYAPAPPVVYLVSPQPQVIYRQPPQVFYTVPAPRSTVVVRQYPSNVIVEAATIEAAGRVAAAAVSRNRTIEVIERRDGGRRR